MLDDLVGSLHRSMITTILHVRSVSLGLVLMDRLLTVT